MTEPVKEVRRYGCYKYGIIIGIIIVIITIIAIVVQILTPFEKETLLFCGILLFVIAIASFIFIDIQRRKAAKRKEASANKWIRNTFDETRSSRTLDETGSSKTFDGTLAKTWKFDKTKNTNDTVNDVENNADESNRSSSLQQYETLKKGNEREDV